MAHLSGPNECSMNLLFYKPKMQLTSTPIPLFLPLRAPGVTRGGVSPMPAVAVTDHGNMYGTLDFYKECNKQGIKPIIGADVMLRAPDDDDHITRLVLLCQDRRGYLNLCELLSLGFLEGQHHGIPYVRKDWVEQHAEGLIALSGGREGDIGQAILAGHPNRARQMANDWARVFPGRFYIEIQRTGREQEKQYEIAALSVASDCKLPVIASNDVRFLNKGDFQAHEARVCIHDGRLLSDKRREVRYSDEQYLKSPEKMAELFADLPEAIENSWHLAMRCNLQMDFGTYYLPDFPTPDGMSIADYLDEYFETDVIKAALSGSGIIGTALGIHSPGTACACTVETELCAPSPSMMATSDFARATFSSAPAISTRSSSSKKARERLSGSTPAISTTSMRRQWWRRGNRRCPA